MLNMNSALRLIPIYFVSFKCSTLIIKLFKERKEKSRKSLISSFVGSQSGVHEGKVWLSNFPIKPFPISFDWKTSKRCQLFLWKNSNICVYLYWDLCVFIPSPMGGSWEWNSFNLSLMRVNPDLNLNLKYFRLEG